MMSRYIFQDFSELDNHEIQLVWQWRNDQKIREWSFHKEIFSLKHHLDFIALLRVGSDKKYWLVRRSQNPVGVISVVNIMDTKGEFGFYIAPEYHGKHLSFEFLYNAIDFIFSNTEIRTLIAYSMVDNSASNYLLDSFGFTKRYVKKKIQMATEDLYYRNLSFKNWSNIVKTDDKIIKTIEED